MEMENQGFPGFLSNMVWDTKGSHALGSLFSRKTFGKMSGWRLFLLQIVFQRLWLKYGFRWFYFKMHRPGRNNLNVVSLFSFFQIFLHSFCSIFFFISFFLLSPASLFAFFWSLYFLFLLFFSCFSLLGLSFLFSFPVTNFFH